MWLRDTRGVVIFDRHYSLISVAVHLVLPALIYGLVWALGGSLILTLILHASAVVARGVQVVVLGLA